MSDRDRLIELLQGAKDKYINLLDFEKNLIAKHLLENGVIVPPCNVGDVVYVVSRYYSGDWEIYQCEIESITIYKNNTFISCVAKDIRFGKINFALNVADISKTVFLTKEEAEKALAERNKNESISQYGK